LWEYHLLLQEAFGQGIKIIEMTARQSSEFILNTNLIKSINAIVTDTGGISLTVTGANTAGSMVKNIIILGRTISDTIESSRLIQPFKCEDESKNH
jgi:hypothetical protein